MSAHSRVKQRRKQRNKIVINDITVCYHCKQENLPKEEECCHNCGFPQNGTPVMQRNFILNQRKKKSAVRNAKSTIAYPQNILILTAIIFVPMFMGIGGDGDSIGIFSGVFFFVISFFVKKKPIPILLAVNVYYIVMFVFLVIMGNSVILSGWVFIVFSMFLGLFGGLLSAINASQLQKQLDAPKQTANKKLKLRLKANRCK